MPLPIAPDVATLDEGAILDTAKVRLRRHPNVGRTLKLPVSGEQSVGDRWWPGRVYGNDGGRGRDCWRGCCRARHRIGGGERVIDRQESASAVTGRESLPRDTDVENGALAVRIPRAVHRHGAVDKPRLRPLQGLLCLCRLPLINGGPRRLQEGVRWIILGHRGKRQSRPNGRRWTTWRKTGGAWCLRRCLEIDGLRESRAAGGAHQNADCND